MNALHSITGRGVLSDRMKERIGYNWERGRRQFRLRITKSGRPELDAYEEPYNRYYVAMLVDWWTVNDREERERLRGIFTRNEQEIMETLEWGAGT